MSAHNQFHLLGERRFGPYFLTQFLGAFNDNVFKNALVILIAYQSVSIAGMSSNTLINLSAGLFILPFFLFSAMAGQLSDKFEKSWLIQRIKLLEIFIMALAAIGFFLDSIALLIIVLFLMGTQSALFGPIKFSILPQHLRDEELVGGNGLVESGTFLAILLGTIIGGILISFDAGWLIVSISVILFAILGWLTSRAIPVAIPAEPQLRINWNAATQTWRSIKFVAEDFVIFQSVLAISWFWFYGATYLAQFPNYTLLILEGNEHVVTVLLTLFSLGIGVGSLLCERMSGHKVEIGLVPFGSIGLTLFSIDLSLQSLPPLADGEALRGAWAFLMATGSFRIMMDIVLMGMFGGFFIVPLYALIQQRANKAHISRIIAGNNIINALFMVMSAVLAIVFFNAGLSISDLFLVIALMNAAVAIYIFKLVPEFLMRFLVWIFIQAMCRIEKSGLDKIPDKGPAVIVCNHVSYFDPLVIMSCCRRPVRFVMYYKIHRIPILSFIFRTAKTIPIAGARENIEIMEAAFSEVKTALGNGELVCIFPEGGLTPTGEVMPFRPGIERIITETPVPVIPTAISGLWNSIFSRNQKGSIWSRLPRYPLGRIAFRVMDPQAPQTVSPASLQAQVLALRGDWR